MVSSGQASGRLEHERELYLALLDLHHIADPSEGLKAALELAVRTVGAERGFLEVYSPHSSEAALELDTGMDSADIERARARVSRGIITEALAEGRTVHTPSALLDARFAERESVRRQQIEAVVCAPLGASPVLGVIYLAGAPGAGPFDDEDVALLERVVHHLAPVAQRLLERPRTDDDPTRALRAELAVSNIIGRSKAIAEVLGHVRILREANVPVIITGPSGTGKSLLARAIHANSKRAGRGFVHINCSTLPSELFENELFGAVQGAHSTATHANEGKLAAAQEGTIFLDEVAELSTSVQAKLLTVLDENRYYPVGGNEERHADVRIISATNADLERRVADGRFRSDLYHRLHVYPVRMPTLTERIDDIPLIAEDLVRREAEQQKRPPLPLSPAAMFWLQTQEWTGNVRELQNVLTAGVVRARGNGSPWIEVAHLSPPDASTQKMTYHDATRAFQRGLVHRALRDAGDNASDAAKLLGITRSHFYNLIKIHGRSDGRED